ncbi:MAG: hypothetical protein NUV69_00435 [Candidatus Curtissbacteria bacterium]|nr:hypothetical protein [Candidatus Curtissbacteria bacterium]
MDDFLIRLASDPQTYPMFVASFLLVITTRQLNKMHNKLDRLSTSILLLVLNNNGSKKAAREKALELLNDDKKTDGL